jgi:hypothetical protein
VQTEESRGKSEPRQSVNLVIAVPADFTVAQLLGKVEQEHALLQQRLTGEHTGKLKCRTIFIKEVFEVCDHRALVSDVFTDYMEVTINADKKISPPQLMTDKKEVTLQPNPAPAQIKKFVEPSTMHDFKRQLEANTSGSQLT